MNFSKAHYLKLWLFNLLIFLLLIEVKADYQEQRTNVLVRMIGDEILTQIGDSTSRILPIENINGKYLIQFENEYALEPDMISFAAIKVMEESDITTNFIIETVKCSTNYVVHSFEISTLKDDSKIPCKSRALQKDCYMIYLTFLEEKKNKINKDNFIASFGLYYFAFILLLLLGLYFYFRKKKYIKRKKMDLIPIGVYLLDKKGMKLIYKRKSKELSSKETDLLDILYSNKNQTVKREQLLQQVWGDEGDYVGRTLDVFVSKLRKKLEQDPNLKIVNVRGVGYRFVI